MPIEGILDISVQYGWSFFQFDLVEVPSDVWQYIKMPRKQYGSCISSWNMNSAMTAYRLLFRAMPMLSLFGGDLHRNGYRI